MNILEAIRIALQSLWANKLRSVLTLLGVVIGVAAVIAVVTFVNGINGYVAEKIFNLGADVFIISKVTPVITNVDHSSKAKSAKTSPWRTTRRCSKAAGTAPWWGLRSPTTTAKSVRGTDHHRHLDSRLTPSMAPILDLDLTSGRMINEND